MPSLDPIQSVLQSGHQLTTGTDRPSHGNTCRNRRNHADATEKVQHKALPWHVIYRACIVLAIKLLVS